MAAVGKITVVVESVMAEANAPATPTKKPTSHEMHRASGAYEAVLLELASVVDDRDRASGQMGNAKGYLQQALAAYVEARDRVVGLEARAATLRRGADVLSGRKDGISEALESDDGISGPLEGQMDLPVSPEPPRRVVAASTPDGYGQGIGGMVEGGRPDV